jgi:hypothetical protein
VLCAVWGVIDRVSDCQLVKKGIAQCSMIGIVVIVTGIDAVSEVMSIHACNETDLMEYSSLVDCWQAWACCIYTLLPPDDGLLASPKHVEVQ